jgi:hypothetical protein
VYVKPFLNYDLTKSIMFQVWNVSSFALKPVSTPGNQTFYGTEFDSNLGYHTDHLYAGISYGVLFPFGALSHPADSSGAGGPGFGYPTVDANGNTVTTGDPSTAHCIQMRLVLAF